LALFASFVFFVSKEDACGAAMPAGFRATRLLT
jgi:hypothetical protein